MIVARCKEAHDGRDAVAALAIFHDQGLAPTLGKALRDQTRSHVRSGAGRERQDHTNGPLRPGLGARVHCHKPNCEHQTESEDQRDKLAPFPLNGLHPNPTQAGTV
jgi:hypothetical protein